MAYFPLFIDLSNKNCIVIGGGAVAIRKIETLLRFDAAVTVISPVCDPWIHELAQAGKLVYRERRYQPDDLQDAYLAIAATNVTDINAEIYQEATERGIWINVADDPQKCSFIFPAVALRDSIVVGITTSGTFPALAKQIRKKIEKILLDGINEDAGAEILKQARTKVKKRIDDPVQRKEVLNQIAETIINPKQADPKEKRARRVNGVR